MKTIRLLLALVLASVCSVQGAWARIEPTLPEAQTLESGKTYYLFNVGSGRFLYKCEDSNVKASVTEKQGIIITDHEDGTYTMQFSSDLSYIIDNAQSQYDYLSRTSQSYYYSDNQHLFRFTETNGNYYIQRNYEYNANYYVGDNYLDNSLWNYSKICGDQTTGNIVWALFDEEHIEAVTRYAAQKALYNALENASLYYNQVIDGFETIYNNNASTNEELVAAAELLNKSVSWSNAVAKHSLHDSPILLTGDGWQIGASSTSSTNLISKTAGTGKTMELKGIVDVSEASTIYYKIYGGQGYSVQTYVDGELVRSLNCNQLNKTYYYGYRDLITSGKHEIVWKFTATNGAQLQFQEVGVISTPEISVNLVEAGSLGTEVLYNVDNVKDVRNLKIKGKMNSEDWARIKMMTDIFILDLSEAEITEIPQSFASEYQGSGWSTSLVRSSFADDLYIVKLPTNLKTIGAYAFYNSLADDFEIPSTVTAIGEQAFYNSRIKRANLSNLTNLNKSCFSGCYLLEDLTLPDNLTYVGDHCFYECCNIKAQKIILPNTLSTIESDAFRGCSNLNFRFPDKYLEIGREAFNGTGIDSLILHRTYSYINDSWSPFYNMSNLVYAEFPTEVTSLNVYTLLTGCPKLEKIVLKSPTKVTATETTYGLGLSTKTLVVPSYLVNTYKLDSYWYNAMAIEGFSTADIKDWTINSALTMNEHERFEGNPNIVLNSSWKLNGNDAQNINNFTIVRSNGMVLSNCDNMLVNGNFTISQTMSALSWVFVCLPFDIKVSEITCSDDARFAIRYYDGANRAENGTGGNWKDYASDATIMAGSGFIIQTNKACTTYFKALNNESKQNAVSNKIFVKALEFNESEQASNKGWNLVGNPWISYYNIHKLNFTAPITVYSNNKYSAYSVIDDDYAIKPCQAFFVQCPDNISNISFPVDGRQLTSVIESQNGVKAEQPQEKTRWLIDVELSDGEQTDKTRFVLNEKASLAYETSCDASKFIENGTSCPQLYTIENGEALAINERPMGDGTIQLGMIIATDGTYTISAPRNQFQKMLLIDYETGTETDLSVSNYTFSGTAGTDNCRFELRVNSDSMVTGVQSVATQSQKTGRIYNLSGQRVSQPQKGVYIVNGKKIVVK